jgi:hypothetical protein
MRCLQALAIGLALAGVTTAIAEGATETITVSPPVAAPGDSVTWKDHIYGGGFFGTDLYLILQSRYADGSLCSQMPGAIKVATIAWVNNGLNHDGSAAFVMPSVPDGEYVLPYDLPGVIQPCGGGGSITVSASRSPNTAMAHPEPRWGTLLTLAGLIMLVAAAGLARARVAGGRRNQ